MNNVNLAMLVAIFLGSLLRIAMASHLPPHIDEPASILALTQVAQTGLPFLPSGVLYLQGATLSYLSAPLHWLGLDGPSHLFAVRTVPLLAGIAVLPAVALMARDTLEDKVLAALVVAAVAFDPMSAQWSGILRPYSLLELTVVLIGWRSWRLLQGSPRDRWIVPLLFLFGSFTHLLVVLLLPGMLVGAVIQHGRSLFGARRDILLSGALCGLGPASVLLLNQAFDVTSAAEADGGGSVAFVGNHVLKITAALTPNSTAWRNLHRAYGSADAYTTLFLVMLGVLLASLAARAMYRDVRGYWATLGWIGLVTVALFSTASAPRYTLHLHLFTLLALVGTLPMVRALFGPLPMAGVLTLMLWGNARGIYVIWNQDGAADYREVHRVIAKDHRPGQPILSPMPAVSWWLLPELRDDLVFLAGAADSPRPQRYTHPGKDGPEDFWLGVPSVVDVASYCAISTRHPGGWILYDGTRMRLPGIFKGQMRNLLRKSSRVVASGPGDTHVARFSVGPWRTSTCQKPN